MRRLSLVFLLSVALLAFWLAGLPKLAYASDSWKTLPENTCDPYPVVSACNLTYIAETNLQTLTNLVIAGAKGTGAGIALVYRVPPVSGWDYLAYMGHKFHVPGTPTAAYAADGGTGYTSLAPVLRVWVVMRNLAYFIFAIIFVIVGVMVLVRAKIDPKTAATIQNSLPKIIIALVLVTFSYAIAGFLIDLMYVAIALVLAIAQAIDINAYQLGLKIVNDNLFAAFFDGFTVNTLVNVTSSISDLVDKFTNGLFSFPVAGGIANVVLRGLAFLILAVAILWALFKTWLSLLSAYANIILGIIFSPLQLMVDAIPGQNQFEGWLRTMLANLMAFPAVIGMILIGLLLGNIGVNSGGIGPGFVPPLLGNGSMSDMQSLVGIAIVLTIPKVVEILQEILKSPKQKWGSAWSEMLNASRAGLMAGGQYGWQQYGESGLSEYRNARNEALRKARGEQRLPEGLRPRGVGQQGV